MSAARGSLAVCVLLAIGLVLESILVGSGQAHIADARTAIMMSHLWVPALHPLFQGIALLGGTEVTGLVVVALLVVLWWRRLRRECWALLAFPVAILVEVLYKHFVSQPPPTEFAHADGPSLTMLLQHAAPTVAASSFPSGHVVRAVVAYGLVAFVVHRLAAPGRWQRLAVPAALLLVLLIAFDRLYLGVHWQSDVLGGLLLGGLALAAAIVWLDWGAR
jgi:membrane-associated phospholipid phosphatase